MNLKMNKGISLITLVVTIVVLIILTTIGFRSMSNVPDEANFTKYNQVMKNVQVAVERAKIRNSAKGTTEADLTDGFKKVYLEKVPSDFVSFGESDEKVRGYLVGLDEIGYLEAEYGKAYNNYEAEDTLTFGEKEFDVYVFDEEWNVYYLKGLNYNGSMNYNLK